MRLINDFIEKKLTLYNEFWGKKYYLKAIWIFYSIYSFSLAFLEIEEDKNKKNIRDRIYDNLLKNKNFNKNLKEMNKIINSDWNVLTKCFDNLRKMESSGIFKMGNLKQKGLVGILAYEMEALG